MALGARVVAEQHVERAEEIVRVADVGISLAERGDTGRQRALQLRFRLGVAPEMR